MVEEMTNEWHVRREGTRWNEAAQLSCTIFHFSSWALFKKGSHVPLDLSGSTTVCFPLQRGDRFGQGWQRSLFSPPGSLERRGGKLKTGFTRFLETVKQAGGPTVRERGKERPCDRESAVRERERDEGQTETSSQQIRNMCECMSGSVYVPACVCQRENDRKVKRTRSSQRDLLMPTKICLQWVPLMTHYRMQDSLLTCTQTRTHITWTHTSSRPHVLADKDTGCLRAAETSGRLDSRQSMYPYSSTIKPVWW